MSKSSKQRRGTDRAAGRGASAGTGAGGQSGRSGRGGILGSATQLDRRTQIGVIVVIMVLGALVVMATDFVFGALGGSASPSAMSSGASATAANSTAAPAATPTQLGVAVPGRGGHWTNVSAGQLAEMLSHKDFTLVNVKTPYIGEIDGTDLYIPYDQLAARASQLPTDKGAKILVYCRSGVESGHATQTLLDLGYTNVWNLDGGMIAWTASGRQLVQKNR